MFIVLLIISFIISGHKIYQNIAIANVTNSQRGEHQNYQTSVIAKVLHNKSTAVMYYLQNISDRLSPSTIFASGAYPNISKFLPLGFLFPWYLLGFVMAIRQHYKNYRYPSFFAALSILLLLTGILTENSSQIFMFAIIWFVGLESITSIAKLPKKYIYSCLFLNLVYLGIFYSSYKPFLV